MTWFNLFSTELKYKLTVYPSKIERVWLLVKLFVVLLLLGFVFSYFIPLAYVLFALLLWSGLFFYLWSPKATEISFNIEVSGRCQFRIDEIWKITYRSKISYWGCYLCLEKIDAATNNIHIPTIRKTSFYFKDSFSQLDYSRLCRVILKIQKQKNQPDD